MAYNNVLNAGEAYVAASDLSEKQYTFVTVDTSNEIDTTGAGLAATGVLFNAPTAGDAGTVIRSGEPHVYVGTGGLTVGAEVASDADGKAVVATSTDVIIGRSNEAVAAGGIAQISFYGPAQTVKA